MTWRPPHFAKDWHNGERIINDEENHTADGFVLSVYQKITHVMAERRELGPWYASVRWKDGSNQPEDSPFSLRAFGLPTVRAAKSWAHHLHNVITESL